MRLMTIFELAAKNKKELAALFREAAKTATRSECGSAERRNALGTMENIVRTLRPRL